MKKIIGISILLIVLSFIAWGLQYRFTRSIKTKQTDTIAPKPVYDPVLLGKYERLYKKYDTLKKNCTMGGTITITDHADTMANMDHVEFFFCKQGDDFYYKLGATETINAGGLYIFIDNLARTMLISAQKKVAYDQLPSGFANVAQSVSSEGYEMTGRLNGGLQTIALYNEHNMNCKQFSITYDTLQLQVKHMTARMTNIQAPLRHDNEKIVDISIMEWTSTADINQVYSKGDVVKQVAGNWQPVNKYKSYQVTRM